MIASPRHIKLNPESDLAQLLREAVEEPTIIEADGERFRVFREPANLFANYNAARALAAVQGMFGTLPEEAAHELKAELRILRDQDSSGRPA